ncbi:MAG: LysM peptidoglycan-binding domain-containing protein [Bacteroidales bacterium]|nr:LysM peptidoglycan-binding domain-containing protein [Lachnoclostridium sp.]MCM1385374.1 LysM peptidoglycan-binding domain-containing protein [Lachnoclostridium sp.]MCM1466188.1 LysM peptidoglycan-binding domain-containing protein [Bacteroidales bacterium]
MDFCKTIIHIVQQGDTFYRLAQRYQTTVPDIILRNPGVNPYNLQIGTRLRICSGLEESMQKDEIDLNRDMRKAWTQHGFWGTLYLVSLYHALPNQDEVQKRLLQTAGDIAEVFGKFYSKTMENQLKILLTEHIEIAGELMKAIKEGNEQEAARLEQEWRQNADKIAGMFASANPNYDYEELQRMLQMHLDLMKQQMTTDLDGNHEEFVKATDENAEQLMKIADMLTEGIMKQFYRS